MNEKNALIQENREMRNVLLDKAQYVYIVRYGNKEIGKIIWHGGPKIYFYPEVSKKFNYLEFNAFELSIRDIFMFNATNITTSAIKPIVKAFDKFVIEVFERKWKIHTGEISLQDLLDEDEEDEW